jgi:hypothetical protein
VQSGQRQAGPWCCAVCNERWDADIQTRRKHGWVCVRTDAPPRPSRAAAAAAATPAGNGLAALPIGSRPLGQSQIEGRSATATPARYEDELPDEFRCHAIGHAKCGHELDPAAVRRQLASCTDGCCPSFIQQGQGGYTGMLVDMPPSTRRAATAAASAVIKGAATMVMKDDPEGAIALAFGQQVRRSARNLQHTVAAMKKASPGKENGSVEREVVVRNLESALGQRDALT